MHHESRYRLIAEIPVAHLLRQIKDVRLLIFGFRKLAVHNSLAANFFLAAELAAKPLPWTGFTWIHAKTPKE